MQNMMYYQNFGFQSRCGRVCFDGRVQARETPYSNTVRMAKYKSAVKDKDTPGHDWCRR